MPPLPLSALNDFLFCPRRAALKFMEGLRGENEHTLLGDLAHEHVDFPGFEQRAGSTLLRALPLFSDRLGLSGKADVVEVRFAHLESDSADLKSRIHDPQVGEVRRVVEARPVEYKKGPKRRFDNDEVQLCAQALCLEEMFRISVPVGAVFYAQSHQRLDIAFDEALRRLTLETIGAAQALISAGRIPAAELKPQCNGCSLHEICLPELARSATAWRAAEARLYTPSD